ncbi:conserved hypothetical protein [Ricinus communis]|uniref:Uncharacterized protein n=1 Tax=Ricinus communis TaxID=3988 RepID=B9T0H7_RICCO|nr:conserved hypothetical protein [Ricinus communis]
MLATRCDATNMAVEQPASLPDEERWMGAQSAGCATPAAHERCPASAQKTQQQRQARKLAGEGDLPRGTDGQRCR